LGILDEDASGANYRDNDHFRDPSGAGCKVASNLPAGNLEDVDFAALRHDDPGTESDEVGPRHRRRGADDISTAVH
jgi:hypothetical protein